MIKLYELEIVSKKKKKTLEIALRDGATYLVMNCIKPAEESEAMMFYSVEEPKWH